MPPPLKKFESQYKCFTITYPFFNVWTTHQIGKKKLSTEQDCKNSKSSLVSANYYYLKNLNYDVKHLYYCVSRKWNIKYSYPCSISNKQRTTPKEIIDKTFQVHKLVHRHTFIIFYSLQPVSKVFDFKIYCFKTWLPPFTSRKTDENDSIKIPSHSQNISFPSARTHKRTFSLCQILPQKCNSGSVILISLLICLTSSNYTTGKSDSC